MEGDSTHLGEYYRVDQPHKNGSIIPTEVLTTIIPDEKGNIISILGVSRDISHQVQMEEQLKESEAKFRLIAENVGDIIWMLNPYTEKFEYMNSAIQQLGYTPNEIIGHHITKFMDPEKNPSLPYNLKDRINAFQ